NAAPAKRRIRRGARVLRHCVAVRQIDPTNPTFDPSAAKTELAGDLPDGTATFKKCPDLIEQLLPNSLASARHQALLHYGVRSTIRSCWERRRRLIISGIDPRI